MRQPAVYILTNKSNRVLYIGVTAHLAARILQHKAGKGSEFSARYRTHKLVHVEFFPTMVSAIAREKAIKEWKRAWKVALITNANPDWSDLFVRIND